MLAIITFWSQSVIKSAIRTSGLPAIKTTMDRHFVREARKKVTPSNEPKRNSMKEIVKAREGGQVDRGWRKIDRGEEEKMKSEGIRSFAAVIIWHNYWLSFDDSSDNGGPALQRNPSLDRSIPPIDTRSQVVLHLRGKCFATRFRMQSGLVSSPNTDLHTGHSEFT